MCVCVGGEAGVLAVIGFQRLTPKLFIFSEEFGISGGHFNISTGVWAHYVLYGPKASRRGGSEEKMEWEENI